MHLTVKIDPEWDNITVEQLEDVILTLKRILNVRRRALYLRSVEKGCVKLTFLIPAFVAKVFPLSSEQEAALFQNGVIRLCCGDYCFSHRDKDIVSI